ncbi:MAG: response regulator [Desulfococcaceae bacterium]
MKIAEPDLRRTNGPGGDVPMAAGTARILVVEDEPTVRDVLRLLLSSGGHSVVCASRGDEGLRTFQQAPDRFDLVITDSKMPGLPGEKMVAVIRRVRPKVPILMLSGFGDRRMEEQAKAVGIDCFLAKPIGRRELMTAVDRLLRAEKRCNAIPIQK